VLPVIGDLALGVAKNLDVLAASLGALAAGAIVNAISLTGGLGAAFASLKTAILATNAALLLNPWVALAAGIAAATVAIIKHSQAQKEYNNLLDNGAGSSNELRSTQRDLEAQITAARKALEGSGNSMGATGRQAMQLKMKIAELENQLARINKTFAIRLKLEREGFEFDESGRTRYYTVAGVTYDIKTRAPVRGTQTPSEFPRLAEDGSGSSKAKKERESQLPQLQAQLAVQQQIAQINAKIRDAQLAENQFLQIRLEGERELAQIAGEIKALAFEKIPANEIEEKRKLLMLKADEARLDIALRLQQAEKQNLIEITQQSDELAKSYTTQIEDRQRLQELIATGMKEALALEYIQIENILKIEKERLEVRKALLEAAGDVGGAQETQDLIDRLGGKETGLKDLAAGAQKPEKGKLQEFIEQAEAELRDLEALAVRISENIGNAIGSSIADGLIGLVEGTTTAKEIFADFLKDVGQILIQEGAKMIATYIAIGIAKTFAGLFSGGGGGEVPGALGQATNTGLDTGAGNISDMLSGLAAKGAYFSGGQANFAQNSIKPFATGGIVTKPTFFKYADGGTFNNGVMGEAGPEAIMPLKRGADGKLGVAARLDGAMKRYRSTPGSAAAAAEGDAASLAAAGAATMEPIDVRYSVERINSVDYVTADQFQAGMAQAAQQGALQGERRAMRSLKNSSATRRSVGI
jgi:phage-related minor tail protein